MSDLHLCGRERDQHIIQRLLIATGLAGSGVNIHPPILYEGLNQPLAHPDVKLIKRVVLLGDVFDFNLGYQHTVFRAHLPFLYCLDRLKRAGIEVLIFTGNHDPDPSPVLTEDLEIPVINQPYSVELYGQLTRLEHGDLLEPNRIKRGLCRGARHSWIRRIARRCPPAITWWITQRWGTRSASAPRHISSGTQRYTDDEINLDPIIEAHWPTLRSQGYHYWIFGHFHQARCWRPKAQAQSVVSLTRSTSESVDHRDSAVFVLGDQVQLNTCLYWDERGPRLCVQSDIDIIDGTRVLKLETIDRRV